MEITPELLSKYSLFGGLEQEAVDYLLRYIKMVHFHKDEIIFKEGDKGDDICLILSGHVRIIKNDVVLADLRHGELFGEMHIIDVMPRSADVIGVEDGAFLMINNRDLLQLRREYNEAFIMLLLNCSRDISRRLRIMNERYVRDTKAAKGPTTPGRSQSGCSP